MRFGAAAVDLPAARAGHRGRARSSSPSTRAWPSAPATHASTALCLTWLDRHLRPGRPGHRLRLRLGGAGDRRGRASAPRRCTAFDIDPQALLATAQNAPPTRWPRRVHVHARAATLPPQCDLMLANILSGTLCELACPLRRAPAARRARWCWRASWSSEVPEVTAAYAAWFDVVPLWRPRRLGRTRRTAPLRARRRHVYSLSKMRADPGA